MRRESAQAMLSSAGIWHYSSSWSHHGTFHHQFPSPVVLLKWLRTFQLLASSKEGVLQQCRAAGQSSRVFVLAETLGREESLLLPHPADLWSTEFFFLQVSSKHSWFPLAPCFPQVNHWDPDHPPASGLFWDGASCLLVQHWRVRHCSFCHVFCVHSL